MAQNNALFAVRNLSPQIIGAFFRLRVVFLGLDELAVGVQIHEGVEVGGADAGGAAEPAVALGAVVDELGMGLQLGVHLADGAGDGHEHVRGGLDGLDDAERVAAGDGLADGGQLDIGELAELLGGEGGDADGGGFAVKFNPRVFGGGAFQGAPGEMGGSGWGDEDETVSRGAGGSCVPGRRWRSS